MNDLSLLVRRSVWLSVGVVAVLVAGCAGQAGTPVADRLNGSKEVPPVTTQAWGTADITVTPSKCAVATTSLSCQRVYGSVTTSGIQATAAHIHQGKPGQNGPVILPLEKRDDNTWIVPSGSYLTDSQYLAYSDGELYVNVHSAANPNGEIRTQLRP
jgi:CHRD domain